MSEEKRYLEELGTKLDEYTVHIRALAEDDYQQLQNVLHEVMDFEKQLRDSCAIGARFNVVPTQLKLLTEKIEKEITAVLSFQQAACQTVETLAADEMLVYVYLFNAQGTLIRSWPKLISQRALLEHSVNRPVYANKQDVLKVLHAKLNPAQHAYVEILIKKTDIIPTEEFSGTPLKDATGFPLLRLRQGSLKPENIKTFFHNEKTYAVVNGNLEAAICESTVTETAET
jgi:hypothetical protein